ncbi:MAG: Crp/Fnr family transcriptional regulator [Gammaproteobacteria bacterium]|jgi:CRP-like cAMP-binding protein
MPTRKHRNTSTATLAATHTESGRDASPGEIAAALGGDVPTPLQSMLRHSRRVEYATHDVIYHQGSATRSVTFITSGLLKLVVHLQNGRERIVRFHRPGSVLGLGGLRVRDNEHTAVALTPVAALRLPLEAVQQLRRDDPETYISLVERWYDYLHEADIWITQFSTGPIRGRVARLLSFLVELDPESAGDQVQLLTCEEMGSVLGVTGESASRILAELKRERILVTDDDPSNELYNADLGRLDSIAEQA